MPHVAHPRLRPPAPLLRLSLMTFALLASWTTVSSAQEQIHIQGSTTFFDRLLKPNLAAIEMASGTSIDVVPNKSIWGVIALLEGRADLAMISANMQGEIEVARKIAPELPYDRLQAFSIASVPISFPVHPSNPIKSLTNEQMRKILSGTIKRWSEVGGPDIPIRVVATQDGGGTVVAVRSQLLDDGPIRAGGSIRPESARHVVQVVAQEPGAIGIAQHKLAEGAKLPEITIETPIVQTLTFIARAPISAKVKAVIGATKAIQERDPL